MTGVIRPMLPADRAVLLSILDSIPEFSHDDVAVAREVVDDYLHDPSGSGYHVLVAEVEGSVVGYICYGPTPLTQSTWDMYWMATLPARQGQGIGGSLMAVAESRIAESGGRLALIETSSRPEYEKTMRFHLHHGYELVARIPDFYAPGDDRLTLQKRLEEQSRRARHPVLPRRQPHLHRPLTHS